MACEYSILHSAYHHPVLRQWTSTGAAITPGNLMYPLFIVGDENAIDPIDSLPDQNGYGVNRLQEFLAPLVHKGLKAVLLFGVPENVAKDACGSAADYDTKNPAILAVKKLKELFPDLLVACDVCLCPFTSHGHCGILRPDGTIDNQRTIDRLAEVAVKYAQAGCDVVAPSDMMDGRILAIKKALRKVDLDNKVAVMSYTAKFASSFYGPFMDAANRAPTYGDKKRHQLPIGSAGLAEKAADRDVVEGADFLMVKPGTAYLDIVHRIKQKYPTHPMAIYHVSGEYVQLWHASKAGALDLKAGVMETLHSMRRAGADILITYFTPRVLDWINE